MGWIMNVEMVFAVCGSKYRLASVPNLEIRNHQRYDVCDSYYNNGIKEHVEN